MKNEDFEWFKEHQEAIIKDHLGQSVVIKDKIILGYYKSDKLAVEAMKDEPVGSYIIQVCLPAGQSNLVYYSGSFSF